jgi:DNA-binding transcriptional ArsR family regulator
MGGKVGACIGPMVSSSLPFVMANVSAMLTALGDPTRQAIFERLSHGPLAVGQLAGALPVSRPAVSQHLRVLKDVGLVFDRQEGTRRLYQVDPDGLAQLRAHLDAFWARSLAAFANRTRELNTVDTIVEAVRREVVVDVAPAAAFEIFTADMTSWWPAAHHIGSAPIQEIVIEPRVGGRWFTRHEDGTETDTGLVTAWEPPGLFAVTWQIGADWKFHPDLVTTVTVRFTPDGPGRTRVVLEHGGLDAYAADAAAMRETFEADGAWTATLAAFATRAAR